MSWVALTGPQLDHLAARLGYSAKPGDVQAVMYEPPWYRHGALLRLHSAKRAVSFIAAGTGDIAERALFTLDGRSQPVHDGNHASGIEIATPEQAADYLRFFCASVEGDDGPFNIVGRIVPGWMVGCNEQPAVCPPRIAAAGEAGLFTGKAWVEYAGMLFIADFSIHGNGYVEMTDDEPIGPLMRDPDVWIGEEPDAWEKKRERLIDQEELPCGFDLQ